MADWNCGIETPQGFGPSTWLKMPRQYCMCNTPWTWYSWFHGLNCICVLVNNSCLRWHTHRRVKICWDQKPDVSETRWSLLIVPVLVQKQLHIWHSSQSSKSHSSLCTTSGKAAEWWRSDGSCVPLFSSSALFWCSYHFPSQKVQPSTILRVLGLLRWIL